VPVILAALYPPPIREHWGDDLVADVTAGGPGTWADTVAGAFRLWIHPTVWPESTAGQTRRVLLVELTVAVVLTALLLRAAGQPSPAFGLDPARPAASAWLFITLAGLAAAIPLPPPQWRQLRRLAAVSLQAMIAPVIALGAMWLLAQSGLVARHPGAVTEVLLRCYYWAVLAFGGLRLCALAGRASRLAVLPGTRRLATAALLVGLGLTLAAAQNLASRPHLALGTAVLSAGLGAIGLATLATGHDLSHGPRPAQGA
jgi:hypothetical protein